MAESEHAFVYRTMVVREHQLPSSSASNPRATLEVIAAVFEGKNLDYHGKEHFGVVYLDARHRVIGAEVISIGCLTTTLVHPREIFRGALLLPCAAIVLFHNHPSGDPEPSQEDLALTRRMAAAGTLMGIEVLDHMVVANDAISGCQWRYVSLHERGVL